MLKVSIIYKINELKKRLKRLVLFLTKKIGMERPIRNIQLLLKEKKDKKRYNEILLNGWINECLKAEFFVTMKCNLKCPMCHQGEYRKTMPSYELNLGETLKAIDNTLSFGIKRIWITGGEIFVRKDIFEVLDYLMEKDIKVDISTNCILLTEAALKKLMSYPNIAQIEFSLDGIGDVHNRIRADNTSFDKTVEVIKSINAQKSLLKVVTFVLQKENIHQINDVISLCKSLGVAALNITMKMFYTEQEIMESARILNISRTDLSLRSSPETLYGFRVEDLERVFALVDEENRRNGKMYISIYPKIARFYPRQFLNGGILDSHKKVSCASLDLVVIDNNGEVLLCGFIKKSFGNILKEPLGKIINSQDFKTIRKNILNNGMLPICKRCCALKLIK